MEKAHRKRETLPLEVRRGGPAAVAVRVVTTGAEVPVPDGARRFAIGSDPSNHLVLDDRYVSAFHCVLERQGPDRLVLVDRDSRNGTFVNGVRVRETEIGPGARVLVGSTALALVSAARRRTGPAFQQLVGRAPCFRRAIDLALRAAKTTSSVLIVGESGSGKELVARLVHEESTRASGPFVALNCGAIPRELIESELFGHERGAFTGALERRVGLFEEGDGGTLFLDEIGELPLPQQARLLRVLEARRVRRVGGAGERAIDVRVVAATNADVADAARRGAFRLDLYHRLAGFEIRLPPLRERPEDVPLLVECFLREAAHEFGPRTIAPATMSALARHDWPGNVRELRNAIQRAAALSDRELRLEHLLPRRDPRAAAPASPPAPPVDDAPLAALGLDALPLCPTGGDRVEEMMRLIMRQALERYGSQRRAAAVLGMSKSTFNDRARRLGIVLPDRKDERER